MEKVPSSLVTSVVSTLPSKIKCYILYAKKNKLLAERLLPLYTLICEQILPQYILLNIESYTLVNTVQHLVFLLTQKVHQSFQSSVIRGCLDQNLALKALQQVTVRLLDLLGVKSHDKFTLILEQQIKNQNLQSQACITAFISYIREPKKSLKEDELSQLMETYETTIYFVLNDIDRHRRQHTPVGCFMTLYPWAYDIDLVDMQIILNNDLTAVTCSYLKRDAQVFWLSNFKCQASVTADEFFMAVKELLELAHMEEYYNENAYLYEQVAQQNTVLSLRDSAELVSTLIRSVSKAIGAGTKLNTLVCQLRTQTGAYVATDLCQVDQGGYQVSEKPDLDQFKKILIGAKLQELTPGQLDAKLDLSAQPLKQVAPKQKNEHGLIVTLTHADTQSNKGISFTVDGTSNQFKFGEGDISHYQLPNDKKLWDSQLQFICDKDGNYFVRDCGRLHPSRLRLDEKLTVQIQKGTVVDLGGYLQYHFDRVTQDLPSQKPGDALVIRPQTKAEQPQGEDFPCLRGRALWANKISDEDQDKFLKELIVEAGDYQTFKLGRGPKMDIPIKLQKLSNEHCSIRFKGSQGWSITETDNGKLSSRGTFIYLKSLSQIIEQEPSNLIPVHDGMILDFINYEVRIQLKPLVDCQLQTDSYSLLLPILKKKETIMRQQGLIKHLMTKAAASKAKQNKKQASVKSLLPGGSATGSQKSLTKRTVMVKKPQTPQSPQGGGSKPQSRPSSQSGQPQTPLLPVAEEPFKPGTPSHAGSKARIVTKMQTPAGSQTQLAAKPQTPSQSGSQTQVIAAKTQTPTGSQTQIVAKPGTPSQKGSMTQITQQISQSQTQLADGLLSQKGSQVQLAASKPQSQHGSATQIQQAGSTKALSVAQKSQTPQVSQKHISQTQLVESQNQQDGVEPVTQDNGPDEVQLNTTDLTAVAQDNNNPEQSEQAEQRPEQEDQVEEKILQDEQQEQLQFEDQILNESGFQENFATQDDQVFQEEEQQFEEDEEMQEVDAEVFEEEEEEFEEELEQDLDDSDIGDLAGDYDLEDIPSELELPSDEDKSESDEEPIISIPNLQAIQADRDCATRLLMIENTEHTVQVDEGDQYSLRQSIHMSSMRQSTLFAEQIAAKAVSDLKSQLAEMLRKKMDIHTLKAQEYSKLENMLTEGNDDGDVQQEPILIQEELQVSDSITQLRIALQEAEQAQTVARQMTQTLGSSGLITTSGQNTMVDQDVQTYSHPYRGTKSNEKKEDKVPSMVIMQPQSPTFSSKKKSLNANSPASPRRKKPLHLNATPARIYDNNSFKELENSQRSQQIGIAEKQKDRLFHSGTNSTQIVASKSKSSWLDTDTLYSQKFLQSQTPARVVFPKENIREDEKHTNLTSDEEESD